MLNLLKGYDKKLIVNNILYNSVEEAISSLGSYNGKIIVTLGTDKKNEILYKIVVTDDMTKDYPDSLFNSIWNKNTHIPENNMVGNILIETNKLMLLDLWIDIDDIVNPPIWSGWVLKHEIKHFCQIGYN